MPEWSGHAKGCEVIDLDRGACREADPALFVSDGDGSADRAKGICSRCEIRLDCLALALSTSRLDGVWGGLTARERARYASDRPHREEHRIVPRIAGTGGLERPLRDIVGRRSGAP